MCHLCGTYNNRFPYVISGYEGRPLDLASLQYLPNDRLQTEKDQIERMAIAALEDYQSIFPSAGFTPDLLDAVDQFYDRERIGELWTTDLLRNYKPPLPGYGRKNNQLPME